VGERGEGAFSTVLEMLLDKSCFTLNSHLKHIANDVFTKKTLIQKKLEKVFCEAFFDFKRIFC
jgi:hypothetical protein